MDKNAEAEALVQAKRAAGYRAADMVEEGMVVGLGTGSTVYFALERLSWTDARRPSDHGYPDIVPDRTTGTGSGHPARYPG